MLNTIVDWFSYNYPDLFMAFICIVALIWIVWKIFTYNSKITTIESDCKGLKDDFRNMSAKLDRLDTNFQKLLVYLSTGDKNFDGTLFTSNSPIQLTELARSILYDMKADELIGNNKDLLFEKLKEKEYRSPYDLQTECILLMVDMFSTDKFTDVRTFIYERPLYKKNDDSIELTPQVCCNVMGIYLRDIFLTEHPEITDAGKAE